MKARGEVAGCGLRVAGCRHFETEFSVINEMYSVKSKFETILVNRSMSLSNTYFNHSRASSARYVTKMFRSQIDTCNFKLKIRY